MRFLAAAAITVALGTGTAWAQHGQNRGGFSGHPAPQPYSGMRSSGPGRLTGPPRSPVNRTPYTGFGAPHTGFSPQHLGLGGQHTGFGGQHPRTGHPPDGTRSDWHDHDRDRDRDHSHHRMPYWPGYRGDYGYGISGWYLSPYVLGYPSTFDNDNSGSYADNVSNQTTNPAPYADNYGARQPYGDYGPQGYGPDPGAQSPNYPTPSYAPSQPGRQLYAPSSAPVESAAALKPEAPVTLIFNDGRPPEHIHNYLLTSTKLTVLDATYREIPLDQINMAATEEANRSAGIDFRAPHGSR